MIDIFKDQLDGWLHVKGVLTYEHRELSTNFADLLAHIKHLMQEYLVADKHGGLT